DFREAAPRLVEQAQRLVEAALARGRAPEVARRELRADRVAAGAPDALRVGEDLDGVLELALVGEDLGRVAARTRPAEDVARAAADLAALAIELEGLVPTSFEIRAHAEVVEHVRLADEIAGLAVDRQRSLAVLVLRSADRRVREVEQVVGVRERRVGARLLGMRGRALGPANRVLGVALMVPDRRNAELELGAMLDISLGDEGQPAVVPLEGFGIARLALAHDAAPRDRPPLRDTVGLE